MWCIIHSCVSLTSAEPLLPNTHGTFWCTAVCEGYCCYPAHQQPGPQWPRCSGFEQKLGKHRLWQKVNIFLSFNRKQNIFLTLLFPKNFKMYSQHPAWTSPRDRKPGPVSCRRGNTNLTNSLSMYTNHQRQRTCPSEESLFGVMWPSPPAPCAPQQCPSRFQAVLICKATKRAALTAQPRWTQVRELPTQEVVVSANIWGGLPNLITQRYV